MTTLRGEVVFDAKRDIARERILQPETVAGINEMLRAVVTSGTGRRAQVPGTPASGKTGTTQSYRDAWFAGYTGNYVAAVWYGNDDYTKTNNLTGGRLPAQTWQKFMAYAHSNVKIADLEGATFERIEEGVVVPEETDSETPAWYVHPRSQMMLVRNFVNWNAHFKSFCSNLTGQPAPQICLPYPIKS